MNTQAFPVPLKIENKADGSQYQFVLLSDFVFLPTSGRPIVVPVGFETDFASIPRPLQGILDADNDVAPAATIHDFLYSSMLRIRSEADSLFFQALRANGVGWLRARLLWAGVRSGGWTRWGSDAVAAADWSEQGAAALERWERTA